MVERPASVVKELVENALDAGARRIEIDLRDAGRTLIRVADDGSGMGPEDAVAALQRHATSKIRDTDDINDVHTLGFRGEALPSIASVGRMTLSTSETDGLRYVLRVEGGQIQPVTGAAGPRGTEIIVEDLFYNTPARLKFLKSDTTELGQAMDHIAKYAMAYPHVAFTLRHNGQLAIGTSGDGDLHAAVSDVWGRETARTLAPIDTEVAGIRLLGLVSPPHVTKPTRAFQHLFVNGRPVRTRTLTAAVDGSFRDLTPERRYPLLVLMLELPGDKVDVNVSPTKSEVKFQQEGAVFEAIRVAVRGALMSHGMMPNAAGIAAANEALAAVQAFQRPAPVEDFRLSAPPEPLLLTPPPPATPSFPGASTFEAPAAPMILERSAALPFADLLDGLKVIGQAMNTFIIAETSHGVVLIDQHVAHERVLYEYLCGIRGKAAIEQQPLLVPQTLHLDRRSAVLLRDRMQELVDVGFELEPFGGESYVVRAVPAALRGRDPIKVLKELVEELVEATVARKLVPTREQIWITTSCHMAVKAGDPLSLPEMERLIVDLAETENPYLCPHGRPITATLSRDAMLRLFKRT